MAGNDIHTRRPKATHEAPASCDWRPISVSQLCELLGVDPERFVSIQMQAADGSGPYYSTASQTVWIVLKPEVRQ